MLLGFPVEICYMIACHGGIELLHSLVPLSRAYCNFFRPLLYLFDARSEHPAAVFKAIVPNTLNHAKSAGADFQKVQILRLRSIFPRRRADMFNSEDLAKVSTFATPIHVAAANGRDGVLSFFLDNEVPVEGWLDTVSWPSPGDRVDTMLLTPLAIALHEGRASTAELLITHGASLVWDQLTALHLAAAANLFDLVERLVRMGLNVNAKDRRGDTPLIYALRSPKTNEEMICLLLKRGADPNIATPCMYQWHTPLKLACAWDFASAIELLNGGASTTADGSGDTRLFDSHDVPDVAEPQFPLEAALYSKTRNLPGRRVQTKRKLLGMLLDLGVTPKGGLGALCNEGLDWEAQFLADRLLEK